MTFHKICAHFCSKWSLVGYGTGAFCDSWIRSIIRACGFIWWVDTELAWLNWLFTYICHSCFTDIGSRSLIGKTAWTALNRCVSILRWWHITNYPHFNFTVVLCLFCDNVIFNYFNYQVLEVNMALTWLYISRNFPIRLHGPIKAVVCPSASVVTLM